MKRLLFPLLAALVLPTAVNANLKEQFNQKRNSAGWELLSTSMAIVDTKNQFSNLYLFWEKI